METINQYCFKIQNEMKKSLTVISFLIFSFSNCSKKSDPVLPPEELLVTSKGWIQTSQTVSPRRYINGVAVTDYYNQVLASCKTDDILTFTANGTSGPYIIDEGATKCNPNDPSTVDKGTWTLNANKTTIEFKSDSPSAIPYTYIIVSLTSTTFKSIRSESDNITVYTYTITYTAVK